MNMLNKALRNKIFFLYEKDKCLQNFWLLLQNIHLWRRDWTLDGVPNQIPWTPLLYVPLFFAEQLYLSKTTSLSYVSIFNTNTHQVLSFYVA